MGYRLQMSAEIRGWPLRQRPARLAGQALAALAEEGEGLGSPPGLPGGPRSGTRRTSPTARRSQRDGKTACYRYWPGRWSSAGGVAGSR